jgi:dihydropteroate synthase
MANTADEIPVASYPIGPFGAAIGDGATIMGVVNRSPQSRYRESVAPTTQAAINRGRRLVLEGADLVDVGTESTSPGTPTVAAHEQREVLVPIVAGLVHHEVPVSVETYHPEVARACLAAGASVLNITATSNSDELYSLVAEYQATAIVCFSATGSPRDQGMIDPQASQWRQTRAAPLQGVSDFFSAELDRARAVGLDRVVLDPGAGFSYRDLPDGPTRVRHQMQVMIASGQLAALGHPICNALPHAFTYFGEELRSGEGFFAVLAALGGTSLFRTHEVRQISALLECLNLVADPGVT